VSDVRQVLARRRVTLGFVSAAVVLWLAAPTPASVAAGAAIAAVGESIRIWAAGHVRKAREVTASGPYRWTAHPLYIGSSLMGIGLAVAAASVAAGALVAIYLAATLSAAILTEEKFLRGAFGGEYDRYRGGDVERARGFSMRQAIANREHRALIGLVLVVLLLAWKATYNEPFWRSAGTGAVTPGG
jgi:protein-S-isoprenylcysteine O-methyltransferase Ste14